MKKLIIDADYSKDLVLTDINGKSVNLCIDMDCEIYLDRNQAKDLIKFLNDVFDYNIEL